MGVNKFKPCALTNVSVNYTPEGQWMAYDEGMPISVTMTLSFNELRTYIQHRLLSRSSTG